MALAASGALALSEISNEFGSAAELSFSAYYRGAGRVPAVGAPNLRIPIGKAETGDDFIEDQQHAVCVAEIAQALQEAGLCGDDALQRLGDDRCDILMFIKKGGDGLKIIKRSDQHLVGHALRNPGTVGHRRGEVDLF